MDGTPDCHVWLRGELIPRGKKVTYEMQEIYPGIYTAGVFLFPDEMVQISVRCGDGDEEKRLRKYFLIHPRAIAERAAFTARFRS